jgi:hypothetical protein
MISISQGKPLGAKGYCRLLSARRRVKEVQSAKQEEVCCRIGMATEAAGSFLVLACEQSAWRWQLTSLSSGREVFWGVRLISSTRWEEVGVGYARGTGFTRKCNKTAAMAAPVVVGPTMRRDAGANFQRGRNLPGAGLLKRTPFALIRGKPSEGLLSEEVRGSATIESHGGRGVGCWVGESRVVETLMHWIPRLRDREASLLISRGFGGVSNTARRTAFRVAR